MAADNSHGERQLSGPGAKDENPPKGIVAPPNSQLTGPAGVALNVAGKSDTTSAANTQGAATDTPANSPGSESVEVDPTKAELYEEAAALDIPGRSAMDKGELEKAVAKAKE